MEENLKQLLLRDLCARLPYDVKVWVKTHHGQIIESDFLTLCNGGGYYSTLSYEGILNDSIVKPYLRQMYSMTEEERKEYYSTQSKYTHRIYPDSADFSEHTEYSWTAKTIDWLNAHHFDYRGLIPEGLAIEASKDMYNEIRDF